MKTKNSGEGNQWSQCVQRRYVQKASLPDITAVQGVSSLSGDSKTAHHSPASESLWKTCEGGGGGKPFAQGWTHTDRRRRRFFKKRWQASWLCPFWTYLNNLFFYNMLSRVNQIIQKLLTSYN